MENIEIFWVSTEFSWIFPKITEIPLQNSLKFFYQCRKLWNIKKIATQYEKKVT